MVLLEEEQVIHQNTHLLVTPKELNLEKPSVHLTSLNNDGRIELKLETDVFTKSVEISTAEGNGTFSNNFFDLFPNEVIMINFIPRKTLADKLSRFQIRSLYDIAN